MSTVEHQRRWVLEQRRLTTLMHLGVAPLACQIDAPGARPVQRLTPPEAIKGRSDGDNPIGRAETVAGAALAQGSSATEPVETRKSLGQDQPVAATAAPVAFQLLIVSAGQWLWLEQLEDALIRREQLQLVQGMARSISEGDVAMTHLQFDWPLASHAHLPRDADAARESVAGQLRRLARERQARGVVLMGAACKDWVHVPPALLCLEIPATLAMLTTPALKRDAWGVLQPHSR